MTARPLGSLALEFILNERGDSAADALADLQALIADRNALYAVGCQLQLELNRMTAERDALAVQVSK